MNIKKVLLASITVTCLVFSACVLSGCIKSDKEKVTEIVTAELQAIKDKDQVIIDAIANSDSNEELSMREIDSQELAKAMLSGFDYIITNVEITNGNSATVTADVTHKSFGSADKLFDELENEDGFKDKVADLPEKEQKKAAADLLMKAIEKAPTKNSNVVITLTKTNNAWKIDSTSESSFAALYH